MYAGTVAPSRGCMVLGFVFGLLGFILLLQGVVWLGIASTGSTFGYALGASLAAVGTVLLIISIVACIRWRKTMREHTQQAMQSGQQGPVVVGYDPNRGTGMHSGPAPAPAYSTSGTGGQSYPAGYNTAYNYASPPPYNESMKQ